MQTLRRVLFYEIFGYWPPALVILESTNRTIQNSLSSDLSHIHFFLENEYQEPDVRTQDWAKCKALIKSHCQPNKLIAGFLYGSNELTIENVVTKNITGYRIPINAKSFDLTATNMVFLSETELFFCGAGGGRKDTHIFNLNNEQLEKRSDMNYKRGCHGLIKPKFFIYVFGGSGDTAEKYDLTTDSWTIIDNRLPEVISFVN